MRPWVEVESSRRPVVTDAPTRAPSQSSRSPAAARSTFVASESSALRFAGWSAAGIGAGPGDINFALRLQGGVAEVRESGAYRSEIRFNAGDSFAIAVENGTVRYSKNGTVFYSSAVRADHAMRVHVVLFSASASIGNVAVGSATMSAPSAQ